MILPCLLKFIKEYAFLEYFVDRRHCAYSRIKRKKSPNKLSLKRKIGNDNIIKASPHIQRPFVIQVVTKV